MDSEAPTQPILWIRPNRTPWWRRRGIGMVTVLLAVFTAAAVVDATTTDRQHTAAPAITAAAPIPTMVVPTPVREADQAAFLALTHRKVTGMPDEELVAWAGRVCGHLDRFPSPMGMLAAISAVHNGAGLDAYRAAWLAGSAVKTICPRHLPLINP